jgi:hypothetical protein
MAYKAPPFYSGHYGRMADLSLQRGQQEAEAIRQTWGAVGNVLPSTIGQIQQYQQDEQQRQYYETVKERQDFAHQQEIRVRDNEHLYNSLYMDSGGRHGVVADSIKELSLMPRDEFKGLWGSASLGAVAEMNQDATVAQHNAMATEIQNNTALSGQLMSEAVVPLSRVLKDPNPNSQYVAWNRFMNGVGDTPGFRSRVKELDVRLGTNYADQLPEFADMEAFTAEDVNGVKAGPDAIQRVWDGLVTMEEMRATADHTVEQYGLMVAADEVSTDDMTPDYLRAFEVSAMPLVAEEFLDDQSDKDIQESMARIRDMYPTNGQWLIDEFMKKVNPAEYEEPPVGPPGSGLPVDPQVKYMHPATKYIDGGGSPNDDAFTTAIQNWQSQIYAIKEGQPNVAKHGLDWMQVGTLNALGRGADVPKFGTGEYYKVMSWWRDRGGQRGQEMWDDFTRDMTGYGDMVRKTGIRGNSYTGLTPTGAARVYDSTDKSVKDEEAIYELMKSRGLTEPEQRYDYVLGNTPMFVGNEALPVMTVDPQDLDSAFGDNWDQRNPATNKYYIEEATDEVWRDFIDSQMANNTLRHLELESDQLNVASYSEAQSMFSGYLDSISTPNNDLFNNWASVPNPEKKVIWDEFLRNVEDMAADGMFGQQFIEDDWDLFGDYIDRYEHINRMGSPLWGGTYDPLQHVN